jgi:hypothetical protein
MANDKPTKERKSPKLVLFPFLVGMGLLVATWFYWPTCEAFFILRYFKAFNSAINPTFILVLYLTATLFLVFLIARLIKRFSIFMGYFLPFVIYIGLNEWKTYESTFKFIDLMGVINLLFTIFSKRSL